MFVYPEHSKVERVLPKNKIYGHAQPSRGIRQRFISEVDEIVWRYKLAPATIHLPARSGVEEIQIFQIALKTGELREDVLRTIDRAIPSLLFFELTFQGKVRFSQSYLLRSSQMDESGNRMVVNTDANGRFHSAWISMMYSRLRLARNLLRDDGVIFISIDDGEVKAEKASPLFDLDIGLRVLKIDTSNMRDVYYAPDAVQQADLLGQVDNIRPGRTPEDLLFQILVDEGLDLALPITEETVAGKTIFFVDGNALAACFDGGVSDELVKEIAKRKPLRAVFRDASYGSDSVKINVDQIFRLLSPETEVRSL